MPALSKSKDKITEFRGLYVENITAEIMRAMADILDPKVKDTIFLNAQEEVRKIIDRETIWE